MREFEELRINNKVVYKPQKVQKDFHNAILNRDENGYRDFLFGGSAKPGKSYALRWEAHRNGLEYENIKMLFIRSSFPELENTHLLQLQFDFPPGVMTYNGQRHRVTYTSTNSILQFGYGDKLTDFSQYLSTEWDVLFIDELTTIPFEFSYLLRSRLAGSRKDFIPFWANATNPGNRGHTSVKAYFMDKNPDKEIYTRYKESEVLYIHSTVYDNLILLERDPEVLKRLQQLPPREQQKYLYGNWDIFEGSMFDINRDVHVIPRDKFLAYDAILSHFHVMGSIDYGNTTVVLLGAKDSNGNVIVFDEWKDKNSTRNEKIQSLQKFLEIRNMLNIDIIADTNMWIPDAFDVEDTNIPAYDFQDAGFNLYPVSKTGKGVKNRSYRIACNDTIKTALYYKFEDNEIKVQPKLKIYSRCKYLIESISSLITDPNDPDDIADNQEDHGYDALKYLYMNFMTPPKPKDEDKYEWLKQARLRKMKQLSQGTTVVSE